MTSSLLVLTDFTQPADHALVYASTLAQACGAQLVLLHVYRDSLLDPERFTGEIAELNTQATDLALASLIRELPVPAVAEIGHGRVIEAVASAVHRHSPLLLVVGRSTADNTPDELISATALDLLRAVPCPLLVVPNTGLPFPAPRRLLLAVDGEPFTLGDYAGIIRHLFDAISAELTVLHVLTTLPAPQSEAEALESVQRTGLLADLAGSIQTSMVEAAYPADGILQVAQPAAFDMVVVIARTRSFFGALFHRSVTAQVLLHSQLPVLVLPAK